MWTAAALLGVLAISSVGCRTTGGGGSYVSSWNPMNWGRSTSSTPSFAKNDKKTPSQPPSDRFGPADSGAHLASSKSGDRYPLAGSGSRTGYDHPKTAAPEANYDVRVARGEQPYARMASARQASHDSGAYRGAASDGGVQKQFYDAGPPPASKSAPTSRFGGDSYSHDRFGGGQNPAASGSAAPWNQDRSYGGKSSAGASRYGGQDATGVAPRAPWDQSGSPRGADQPAARTADRDASRYGSDDQFGGGRSYDPPAKSSQPAGGDHWNQDRVAPAAPSSKFGGHQSQPTADANSGGAAKQPWRPGSTSSYDAQYWSDEAKSQFSEGSSSKYKAPESNYGGSGSDSRW